MKLIIFSSNVFSEEFVLSYLKASPFMNPFFRLFVFTFFPYRGGEFHITYCYSSEILYLTEINGYVNTTYVSGYRQEAKTVTCYSKALFKHRISHVPNLIQVLNA